MPNLKAGDCVEVRSKAEILETLDGTGRLEGLPFMPQMFYNCGRRFIVLKRAHKTCDTVFPVRGRKMADAVHLDIRCDGEAYGGCQASCLIFWKEAWLKRVDAAKGSADMTDKPSEPGTGANGSCTEAAVCAGTKASGNCNPGVPRYVCQATQLPYFTTDLRWWDAGQYIEDYRSGNVGLGRMVRGFVYMAYNGLVNSGIGAGPALRWIYDQWQRLWGGIPYPRRQGTIPASQKTPTGELGLQPGELVRVKSYAAILATLDPSNKNRGLYFDAEMVPHCGRTFRVLKKVTKILDEKTGEMLEFKNPCIILEGVACESRYSECRLFCPRGIYSYWREIWLERVEEESVK